MKIVFEYASPLGKIFIESDGKFLTGLLFGNSSDEIKRAENSAVPAVVSETRRWLDIYFSGREPDFTPDFRIENLTEFRRLVVEEMLKIPFGKTAAYGEIAENIAAKKHLKKMSAQAVGGAVGWNPICIIVPCHRVMGSNGNLTGYGGGIKNKIALLKNEGINVSKFSIPKNSKYLE